MYMVTRRHYLLNCIHCDIYMPCYIVVAVVVVVEIVVGYFSLRETDDDVVD